VPVDIDQAGAVRRLVHQVLVPDLVVQRAGFGHFSGGLEVFLDPSDSD
jgi:hypothetical protein